MKKQITLLSGLLLMAGAYAQTVKINAPERMNSFTTEKSVVTKGTATPAKALGTVFYTNDFSNTADWTIDNDGQTGATFGWNINNTVQSWYGTFASGLTSTSGGNQAELSNGLPSPAPGTQALGVTYTLTTAAPIDLTTSGTDVTLQFLQTGAKFYDLQEMQISTNGTTFVTVGNNENYDQLSTGGGSPYPNPDTKRINLASYLGGATQVWIRFSWTTARPDVATNPNVWITYGWFIDDVTLETNPDYDLAVTDNYWGSVGLGYYQIPLTQVAPIDYTVNVFNQGTQTMTNVVYNVNITPGGFTGTSAPASIPTLTDDSLALTTQFTPSTLGTYTVSRSITATDADDVPTNNAISNINFDVTNYIYARDNNIPNGYGGNGVDPFELGNLYDIFADQIVKGVNTRFATGTPIPSEVYARIYVINPNTGDFDFVVESPAYTLTAANLNTNYVMYLGEPVQLLANNTYLVVVGTYDPTVRIANGGTADDQTSFLLDGNDIGTSTLFYTNSCPIVRLNFDPVLGVDEIENASDLTVAPNPFNNSTTINFNLKADASVAVTITDLAGRVVMTIPATQMNAGAQSINIDGSSFKSGVYNYTLSVDNNVITKRIVKN